MPPERPVIAQSKTLAFRWTMESDLDAVLQLESEKENRSFILPWTHQQHRDACSRKHAAADPGPDPASLPVALPGTAIAARYSRPAG